MSSSLARRHVLTSLAGLPLAAVLADARLARAAAAELEPVSITTIGGRKVKAALALPKSTPASAVLLVHEWWGLNDQIKTMAGEFAREGYLGLAVDLYDGQVADTRDGARALMKQVKRRQAVDTLTSWIGWLRNHEKANGKVGTVGWCFGGGWSLNASIAAPIEATVVYYGRVNREAKHLKRLKGPVLGHFATLDGWIDKKMVSAYEAEMKQAGKPFESHWYEADHAFANPTSARYDEADAKLAWERTLAFYRKHL